ncbi:unnamed protein product [Penicillium camemberti]|uniref:Str. FM013 n=1 Tax=Penicillium camemberti (strain FM 013) TaxID=1429867 RepID=A0A0G4NV09_PENC3|nr:unnamed protein product [Penicillium camemberti]
MQQGFHFREEAEGKGRLQRKQRNGISVRRTEYTRASGAVPKSGNGGSAQWQIVTGISAFCASAGLGWSQRIPALK